MSSSPRVLCAWICLKDNVIFLRLFVFFFLFSCLHACVSVCANTRTHKNTPTSLLCDHKENRLNYFYVYEFQLRPTEPHLSSAPIIVANGNCDVTLEKRNGISHSSASVIEKASKKVNSCLEDLQGEKRVI